MQSNNLCEGGKSNQYWSPIEAVLVSISNQYYSTSRPVLLTKPTSTGRNHPSAQSYTTSTYRRSISLACVRCTRMMFYSGRTTRAPLTLSYRCSHSTPARSAGFSMRDEAPSFCVLSRLFTVNALTLRYRLGTWQADLSATLPLALIRPQTPTYARCNTFITNL